ncbi:MAG: SUMF1/EgtB/PvdO family nonheme iron enzyme [Planctomycetes bacterium]|nr:SUMF1/EgtB/PvdO family nonheme iron enzyme [Planctomycetota bacterium]
MPEAAPDLLTDPLLRDLPTIEGYKVLDSVALWAKVGQGGMGVVYRGHHCVLEIDCAVKVLKPSLAAEDPTFVSRLLREARVAAQLNHQNIVRLFDAGYRGGLHFLVMEFITGENVRARVERLGPQSEAAALAVLAGAAAGLAEAHRAGIVHRDVKPDNLLVARDGRVKVVDLGLVRNTVAGRQSVSLASSIMGTPQYMAPEQWDSPDVTPAADVWALGATLWFLLTGEHALEETSIAAFARRVQERDFPSLRERRPGLGAATYELFERCVARDPAARFADARSLLAALRPLAVDGGEELLADPAAGTGGSAVGLATPPPRSTLGRIRAELETPTRIGSDDAASEARTVVSRGRTVAMAGPGAAAPRRRPWLAVAAVVFGLCGGVLWYGYEDGWFEDPHKWDEAERVIRVRRLFEEAEQVLPQPGRLGEAIEKLRAVLDEAPDHARAKVLLALALDRRAEERVAADVDAAFADATEAVQLDPANTAAAQRLATIRAQLQSRLMFGLELTEPADEAVVVGTTLPVRGKVPPAVFEVQVVLLDLTARTETRHAAKVVAGTFEVVVPLPDAGSFYVGLSTKDKNGIEEAALPHVVHVMGSVGALGQPFAPDAAPARPWVNGAGLRMQPIAARTFRMGTPLAAMMQGSDEAQHSVTITTAYWMASTEVTRDQWRRVMPTTPWTQDGSVDVESSGRPAAGMTWLEAEGFCERLTAAERAAGRLPQGWVYALPTEAQWESAARGDDPAAGAFAFGNDVERLGEYAVFGGVAGPEFVGGKKPNGFGLYDMAGNVAEWCADCADGTERVARSASYVEGAVDPLAVTGDNRIVRGGSHASPAGDCRSAARVAVPPLAASPQVGLRVVLTRARG